MSLLAAAAWAASSLLAPTVDGLPTEAVDPRAQRVFARTKTTEAIYSLYNWNWVLASDGARHSEWAAEFHSGALHRVETPLIRVVADCAAGTGTMYNVATGERRAGADIAGTACGINSNAHILGLAFAGSRDSRFGPVDTIRLTSATEDRTYAVDRDGILLAAEIFSRHPGQTYCLQGETTALERRLPDGDIFSVESLSRSVVADRYRAPPDRPVGDLWISGRHCPATSVADRTGSPS